MTDRWRLLNGKELYEITADPGQKQDVAQRHGDVVRKLRREYETWWNDISQGFDEYSEIVIGSNQQNPARLTCFEWHSSRHWWQDSVREASPGNGFWAIDVAQAGNYEITLRRWPEELNLPITAATNGAKAIDTTQARIKIGSVDQTMRIPPGASEVTFPVRLTAGKARLATWLLDKKGNACGAYYASLKRVEP